MKRFIIPIVVFAILAAAFVPAPSAIASAATVPTFSIVSVVKGESVTIKTANFPANYDFKVLMGKIGTKGVGGTLVTTTNSGTGGTFTITYNIPAALKTDNLVAIRLESTKGGYYAYNWFVNDTSTSGGGSDNAGYSGIPTFAIATVVKDSQVAIKTKNFPKNTEFKVLMGKYGTLGVGGTLVTTTNSGAGGTFTIAYTIPEGLKGQDRIAIRLEATSGGYYAYNWFYNSSTSTSDGSSGGTGGGTVPVYTGIPTFSISAVVKDGKVTIKTSNFPKNTEFKVLMGKYGTLGVGGTQVTTTNSGEGGVFTVTYDIPAGLKGQERIAIRLQATSGGYYAYNWFWNNDAP